MAAAATTFQHLKRSSYRQSFSEEPVSNTTRSCIKGTEIYKEIGLGSRSVRGTDVFLFVKERSLKAL